MKLRVLTLAMAALTIVGCSDNSKTKPTSTTTPAAEEKVLNIYNWSDYIAKETIPNFEKETGIKVHYDVFDSNEVLEAKLVSGNTGYDLVVPSLQYLARQVKAGVFQPLDKSKLPNWVNLDPQLMGFMAKLDSDNAHAINWLWGTTGIGYNADKVKAALGSDVPLDSWDLLFKPEYISKLKECGVSVLDTPGEMLPTALNYLGEDPNSTDKAVIRKAEALFTSVRSYITEFSSSKYINELANGDICLAVGFSGDMFIAKNRALDAKNNVKIKYITPKEGAAMWFDMIAIPKDAKHPNNAQLFLDYVMRPKVIADITNAVSYANANKASNPYVNKEILENPGIYPTKEVKKKLFTFAVQPPEVDRLYTRIWTKLKTGE